MNEDRQKALETALVKGSVIVGLYIGKWANEHNLYC